MYVDYGGVVLELVLCDYICKIVLLIEVVLKEVNLIVCDIDGVVYIVGFGLVGVLLVGVIIVCLFVYVWNVFVLGVYYMEGYLFVLMLEEILLEFFFVVLFILGGYM